MIFSIDPYGLGKDAFRFLRNMTSGREVMLYGLDRWQPVRRELLQKLTCADTYLSVAYVKARNGKTRYWTTPAGRVSHKFDKLWTCLRRRIVIFGPSVTQDTLFVSAGGSSVTVSDWLADQHDAGIDLYTTRAAILHTEIGMRDLLPCLESKALLKLARRNPEEVSEAMVSQAMNSDDFPVMDIGIYGREAVGCQITDDSGQSVAFVLLRREGDIIKARNYFNRVCGSAVRWQG